MNNLEAFTDEQKEDVLKYFKRCVMPKDLKDVKKKMQETKELRRDCILNDFQKYQECWNFYFAAPELVKFFLFLLSVNEVVSNSIILHL